MSAAPTLATLQRRFACALGADRAAGPEPTSAPPSRTPSPGRDAARIAIYRNAIRANLRNALRATYPVTCALTGAAFFHAAVDAFAVVHPSRGGDLNVYGDTLGEFLEGYAPAATLPYLPDVARLEWAIDDAYRAADTTAAPEALLAVLAATAPADVAEIRLDLAPACGLLHSVFPVLRIWQVHQPGFTDDPGVDFAVPPGWLVVRREPDGVAVERIDAAEFAWLDALRRGETLGAALATALARDPAFAFERALSTRIADGTLAATHAR